MFNTFFANAARRPQATRLIRRGIGLLPTPLMHTGLELGLNQTFKQPIRDGELDFIAGRTISIQVTDINLYFSLTLENQTLRVINCSNDTELTFSANSMDMLQIVTGRADPDTLFFRRRLAISGDTELGLQLKNYLDSLEADRLIPAPLYRAMEHIAANSSKPQFVCQTSI